MQDTTLDHVLWSQQFSPSILRQLFVLGDWMEEVWRKNGDPSLLAGCRAMNFFFKPSTRTHLSFSIGQDMIGIRAAADVTDIDATSLAKGETIRDTIRTIESLVPDPRQLILVVRHGDYRMADAMAKATNGSKIINAGCGKEQGQHPTQGLQDLWTIFKHGRERNLVSLDQLGNKKGKRRTLNVAMVGDMRNGRTVRSLVYLLSVAFPWVKISLYSPPTLMMGNDILDYLKERGIPWEQSSDYKHLYRNAGKFHVLYDTRFQQEDLGQEDLEQFMAYQEEFQVNPRLVSRMKPKAIILHPLPRNRELPTSVDKDPRAAYFKPQIPNGVIMRMALMYMLLKGPEIPVNPLPQAT